MSIFGSAKTRECVRVLRLEKALTEQDEKIPVDEPKPPDSAVARGVAEVRRVMADAPPKYARSLSTALANLLRRLGPSERDEADAIFRKLRDAHPRDVPAHWCHSLLLKQMGKFEDALAALDDYRRAGGQADQAFWWNRGICATGAGQGELALKMWRELGCKIEMGSDGLPVGKFHRHQVRIAAHGTIVEPTRLQQPGEPDNEYGWVEPRSYCHGVLLTPLLLDEPADVGDLLLWDGAPVRYKKFGSDNVPAFPLLKVLRRGNFFRFRFRGEQLDPGAIAALEESLPRASQLYVHEEEAVVVCKHCADSGRQGEHKHDESQTRRVVSGKLAFPPAVAVREVCDRLREALSIRPSVRLAVPELYRSAGDLAAAERDEALWRELT